MTDLDSVVAARKAAAERRDTDAFVSALAAERLLREGRHGRYPDTFDISGAEFSRLHPRGRYGRFVDVLEKLRVSPPSSIVRFPSGDYASYKRGRFRVHNRHGKLVHKSHDAEAAARHLVAGPKQKKDVFDRMLAGFYTSAAGR